MELLVAQSGTADKISPAPAAPVLASLPPALLRGSLGVRSFSVVRYDTKKSLWPHPHYLLQIREMAAEQHSVEGGGSDRR